MFKNRKFKRTLGVTEKPQRVTIITNHPLPSNDEYYPVRPVTKLTQINSIAAAPKKGNTSTSYNSRSQPATQSTTKPTVMISSATISLGKASSKPASKSSTLTLNSTEYYLKYGPTSSTSSTMTFTKPSMKTANKYSTAPKAYMFSSASSTMSTSKSSSVTKSSNVSKSLATKTNFKYTPKSKIPSKTTAPTKPAALQPTVDTKAKPKPTIKKRGKNNAAATVNLLSVIDSKPAPKRSLVPANPEKKQKFVSKIPKRNNPKLQSIAKLESVSPTKPALFPASVTSTPRTRPISRSTPRTSEDAPKNQKPLKTAKPPIPTKTPISPKAPISRKTEISPNREISPKMPISPTIPISPKAPKSLKASKLPRPTQPVFLSTNYVSGIVKHIEDNLSHLMVENKKLQDQIYLEHAECANIRADCVAIESRMDTEAEKVKKHLYITDDINNYRMWNTKGANP